MLATILPTVHNHNVLFTITKHEHILAAIFLQKMETRSGDHRGVRLALTKLEHYARS